jgi:hypothetical protein
MPREKASQLWKQSLHRAQLARETALVSAAGSRAAKLAKSQELAAARRAPKPAGATLAKPGAVSDMLASLDEILASHAATQAAAAARPAPRRSAAHQGALALHAAYAGGAGDPLAGLRALTSKL